MYEVQVRYMKEYDLNKVVEFERTSNFKFDPDFQVMVPEEFAWNKKEILSVIRQYKKGEEENDTRALVAESINSVEDGWGGTNESKAVVGCVIYEINPEGYDIVLMNVDPVLDTPTKEKVRLALLGKVKEKLIKAPGKDKLTCYVPDGNYENLKFFQKQEWEIKLVRNPRNNDNWLCTHQIKDKRSPGNEQLA